MNRPTKLPELPAKLRSQNLSKWRKKVHHKDLSTRTLGLHAVMCEVRKLKSRYNAASVDGALAEIFPLKSTMVRLQRLHNISQQTMESAMKKFEQTKGKKGGKDIRCSKVLTTSHLEALARCVDDRSRKTLLTDCATAGWTVTKLRQEVVVRQSGSPGKPTHVIKPCKLSKQIRIRANQLTLALKGVNGNAFMHAVGRVKKNDRDEAIRELAEAAKALKWIGEHVTDMSDILKNASVRLGRLQHRATTS